MAKKQSLRNSFSRSVNPTLGVALLRSEKIKPFHAKDIELLKSWITHAQTHEPSDKEAFVNDVNLMLDISGHRLLLPDGRLARLILRKGRSAGNGTGSIQFTAGHGSFGGFHATKIKLASVAKNYGHVACRIEREI